ncbi:MAG TPA: DUF2299 family protein [Pyrinomonadaceae bacterium]
MADRIPEPYEKFRSQIKNWVIEERCQFTPTKGKDWAWAYTVTKEDHTPFTVFQYNGRPESLFISAIADLSDYQQLFNGLTEREQREFVLSLRIALTHLDVEFDVAENLSQINMLRQMFLEDMTRTVFWDKVFSMNKAMLTVAWKVETRIPLP